MPSMNDWNDEDWRRYLTEPLRAHKADPKPVVIGMVRALSAVYNLGPAELFPYSVNYDGEVLSRKVDPLIDEEEELLDELLDKQQFDCITTEEHLEILELQLREYESDYKRVIDRSAHYAAKIHELRTRLSKDKAAFDKGKSQREDAKTDEGENTDEDES